MSTPLAAFGPGSLIVRRTDIAAAPIVNVGFINEFSIDTVATNKQLYGQKKFPLVAAQGTIKCTGKMKPAVISGLAWNNIMFGQTFATGGFAWNINEAQVVPGTPFTVTVTDAATYDMDLGVTYAVTLLPLQRVAAGAEAAGKYSVTETGANKGKYIFSAADTTLGVRITYTKTVATGQSLVVLNTDIGTTPTFQLDYYTNLNQPTSKPWVVRVFACIGNKLTIATKLEDFIMPDLEFDMFADATDRVYTFMFPEVS